jgi:hypothetical protein
MIWCDASSSVHVSSQEVGTCKLLAGLHAQLAAMLAQLPALGSTPHAVAARLGDAGSSLPRPAQEAGETPDAIRHLEAGAIYEEGSRGVRSLAAIERQVSELANRLGRAVMRAAAEMAAQGAELQELQVRRWAKEWVDSALTG